jgi:hypothetical protein
MGKRTIVAIAVGSLLTGAVLGVVVVRYGLNDITMRDRCRMALTAYEMADVDHMYSYVMVQRTLGTPEAYATALKDMLTALDQRDRAWKLASLQGGSFVLSENITRADRALTYARLSLLASQQSHMEEATMYQSKAVAACAGSMWKTCSWEGLAMMVKRLDERGRSPTQSDSQSHGS